MLLVLLAYICQLVSGDAIVKTTSGPIKGIPSSVDGVEAYLSIPYAEPPVGQLRFAKPVPKTKWNETYNASVLLPPCAQISIGDFTLDSSMISEDCLYLNIWASTSKSSRGLRPIIIYIHGGKFSTGTSDEKVLDGSKFAKYGDLIFATVSYRLGAFGFFTTFTEDSAGNIGLYDQIMAIKWIKDNAKLFGGDSENIVLIGDGVGASSITTHMLSPLSNNLFKKAIFQSGSIWNPFYDDDNDKLIENIQSIALYTGCVNETLTLKDDPSKVVDCLRNIPKETIIEAEKKIQKLIPPGYYPRVNDEIIPESASNLFRKGKFRRDLTVLAGITRTEYTQFLAVVYPEQFRTDDKHNIETLSKENATELIKPVLLLWEQTNITEIIDYYINRIKNKTSTGYARIVANILEDFSVTCSTIFTANILSLKGNSVYFYEFDFTPASSPMTEWTESIPVDEFQYVLTNLQNLTSEEQELSQSLMGRWSAFAWTGYYTYNFIFV